MRPKQTDCQIEPAYPDHVAVLFSVRCPDLVGHLPTLRCPVQEPHSIHECHEFDRLTPTLPVSAAPRTQEMIAARKRHFDAGHINTFENCGFPECSPVRINREQIARMLAGYDDATWSKLREDRKRTYQRAADSLITQWSEFAKLFEVQR